MGYIYGCNFCSFHSPAEKFCLYPSKRQTKIAADDTLFFYFYLSNEIRLDVSRESSAMKYQVLFSLKNNEKVFINVACCSRDWRFKG